MKSPSAEERRKQSLRNAGRLLSGCKTRLAKGDKSALLEAIHWSALYGLPLPKWAAKTFRETYGRVVYELAHKSWDEVFGVPPAKQQKVRQKLQRKKLGPEVMKAVWNMRGQGETWERSFILVGKKNNISKSVAQSIYYEAMRKYFPEHRLRKLPG
jgi:hypothetical protein